MPVNSYGNDDFASSFLHGASVGNMIAQQRERQQELASEQALRAVQERHLAAQADQISYALQQKKEQDVKDEIDLQTGAVLHTQLVDSGVAPDEANGVVNDWMGRRNPDLLKKVATAQFMAEKPEIAQQALASRQAIAQGHDVAKVQAATIGASSRNPKGYAPSVSEKDALAMQNADDAVDKAYAVGDATEIDRAEKFRDNLQKGLERQHPDQVNLEGIKAIRNELGTVLKEYWSGGRDEKLVPEINRLKEQIKEATKKQAVGGATPAPAAAASAAPVTRFKLSPSGKLVPAQ